MLRVVQWPSEVLAQEAAPVVEVNDRIRVLASEMLQTMHHYRGVGLAAPQVGIPLRLIVGEGPGWRFALANPEVLKRAEQTCREEEGCLSFAGRGRVVVERPKQVKVRGVTMSGVVETFKARGLLARVLLHEIDHLDGVTLAGHGLAGEWGG